MTYLKKIVTQRKEQMFEIIIASYYVGVNEILKQIYGGRLFKLNELIEMVTEKKGVPVTTSRKVAEIFEKEHKNVLRDVEELDCSKEFSRLNFELSDYKVRGKTYPEYILTKDGFIFLAFGYRGEKAARFKEEYIKQFNLMESFIKSLQQAKLEFPAFTNAIMDSHTEPKHYHYSNEIDMINRIVIGMSASRFKESIGIDKKTPSIRPYLTLEQIQRIEELQRVDIGLIVAGLEFEIRKQTLANYLNKKYLLAS